MVTVAATVCHREANNCMSYRPRLFEVAELPKQENSEVEVILIASVP